MEILPDIESLGRAIRARRRELGLTQQALADLCGVGERFVSEIERGKPTAEIGRVLRVLQRLGYDLWIAQRGRRTEPS